MTLKDYFEKIEHGDRQAFYRRIRETTGVSFTTAERWCKGYSMPSKNSYLIALSKLTKIPVTNLFKTIKK